MVGSLSINSSQVQSLDDDGSDGDSDDTVVDVCHTDDDDVLITNGLPDVTDDTTAFITTDGNATHRPVDDAVIA